ncbi:hypothetical protein SynA1524_00455 [Synechococcus sp. A15-24]|nr:hypothetical protein SynA1524_00455 [Synechococcus sp. A15-24]
MYLRLPTDRTVNKYCLPPPQHTHKLLERFFDGMNLILIFFVDHTLP